MIGQQVAAKATRDAFFLSQFDVTSLPLMVAVAAILSLAAVLAFARGMAVLSPVRMVPLAVAASAALLVAEWTLSRSSPRAAAAAVYVHTALFGATLISGFWSLVNERFDPYSAKRAVGPIGTGASLGGMLGGLVTWRAASLISVPSMLLVLAVLNVLCLPALLRLRPSAGQAPKGTAAGAVLGDQRASPLRLIRGVPYLRNLALVVGLGSFTEALLDYVFSASAAASFGKGGPLMSFFAVFHTAIGLLALAAQATLARPSLARLGLAGTMAVQPAAAVLGSVLVLTVPRLGPIVLLRGTQAVLRNSLFRSAYELLYTPLSPEQKRPTKVIVDVGCDRVGTALGAGVVMAVLLLAPAPIRVLLALAAVSALVAVALVPRFNRGYVAALVESLRTGAVTLDSSDVLDATTRLTVTALDQKRRAEAVPSAEMEQPAQTASATGLADPLATATTEIRSGDQQRIRAVLANVADLDPKLTPHLIPLLARDEIFREVVAGLRTLAPRCTGQLVDALLDPAEDAVVRRRIPRVLRTVPTQRAAEGVLQGLRDVRFDVRYRCAQALVRMQELNPDLEISKHEVIAATLHEISLGHESWRSLDHIFSILSLAFEREPLEIALRALRSGNTALRGTALEYLENVLPDTVRERLWSQLGSPERPVPSGRSTEEIRDDLLRSTASMAIRRSGQNKRFETQG